MNIPFLVTFPDISRKLEVHARWPHLLLRLWPHRPRVATRHGGLCGRHPQRGVAELDGAGAFHAGGGVRAGSGEKKPGTNGSSMTNAPFSIQYT